jgi:DnaK suppressor protein
MSMESNELSAKDRDRLHASLLALADELRALLESFREDAQPVDLDEPIGRLSRMDAIQQQSMAMANRRSSEQRLARVEAALRRIDEDEYGDCLECGEPIALARLDAQPEAMLCVDCQGLRERQLG